MQYIKRFSTLEKATLARKIYADYPDVFMSVESVRDAIRYYTGKRGKKALGRVERSNKLLVMESVNPYDLPEPTEELWEPYYLRKDISNWLVISDLHLPYYDREAVNLTIDWAKKHDTQGILINGDMIDFYQVSVWGKDPTRMTVRAELDMATEFLSKLHDIFKVPIVYKMGNHEERVQWYLRRKAPELYDVIEWRMDKLYDWQKYNVEVVEDQRMVYAGKLPILHGHELQLKSVAVNPARSVFLKGKQSCLVSHTHRVSEHTEPSLEGNLFTTWSIGCLCNLHPEYSRINQWAHGFCFIQVDSSGHYKVRNKRIYKGEIL